MLGELSGTLRLVWAQGLNTFPPRFQHFARLPRVFRSFGHRKYTRWLICKFCCDQCGQLFWESCLVWPSMVSSGMGQQRKCPPVSWVQDLSLLGSKDPPAAPVWYSGQGQLKNMGSPGLFPAWGRGNQSEAAGSALLSLTGVPGSGQPVTVASSPKAEIIALHDSLHPQLSSLP